jgi:uncharacterized protein YciI
MKKFVVVLKAKQRGTLTDNLLKAHVEHLQDLNRRGVLFICGPYTDNERALQIIIADDIDKAKAYVESDPFVANRYYADYELSELIEANEQNNWLMKDDQTLSNSNN